jgi:hypothetical protein
MTRFRTRRMEPGDAPAFNDAYNSLGVAPFRPLEEMKRLWHGGPGGPVKSWIVEADDGAGWRLVGHHGLCPVRFTLGGQDLLFAKTVNSFLLPEFRNRFVYLRFEQRCLAEVEHEFDATYTLAELAAKMRAALGYDTGILELDFEQGLRAPAFLSRLVMRLAWRSTSVKSVLESSIKPLLESSRHQRAAMRRNSNLVLTALDGVSARGSPFFVKFWDEARLWAGLAPRRDNADLTWRFWDAPDCRTTLTVAWPCGARGYGIVSSSDGLHFTLEDIFLSTPRTELLAELLESLLSWCADKGGLIVSFMTTADSQTPEMLAVYRCKMGANLSGHHRDQHVSRRLTALGRERIGPYWPPLNITAITAIA